MSGKADEMKGRAKEAVGDLTDNDDLKREGKVDRAAGKIKDKVDDATDWVEDKVDDVRQENGPRLMTGLLLVIAAVLIIAGIVALVRAQIIPGIALIVIGLLVGPGGVSIFS